MGSIELQKFGFSPKQHKQKVSNQLPPRHKHGEKFLMGPIPLKWLRRAYKLPGKALHVGIILWYWAGIKKNRTIVLSNIALIEFDITRYSKMRALKNLEHTGLVTVERHRGCAPIVTILDVTESPKNR